MFFNKKIKIITNYNYCQRNLSVNSFIHYPVLIAGYAYLLRLSAGV